MHPDVENLGLDYDGLAEQALKLNQSYLDLLKLFQEVNLVPALLEALKKEDSSPLKPLDAMNLSKEELSKKFVELGKSVSEAQSRFTRDPEVEELKAISYNCQVMQKFTDDIDLHQLRQMFIELSNSEE